MNNFSQFGSGILEKNKLKEIAPLEESCSQLAPRNTTPRNMGLSSLRKLQTEKVFEGERMLLHCSLVPCYNSAPAGL